MLEKEEEEWAQQEKMRLEQRKVGQYCDFGDLGSRPTLRQEVHKPQRGAKQWSRELLVCCSPWLG